MPTVFLRTPGRSGTAPQPVTVCPSPCWNGPTSGVVSVRCIDGRTPWLLYVDLSVVFVIFFGLPIDRGLYNVFSVTNEMYIHRLLSYSFFQSKCSWCFCLSWILTGFLFPGSGPECSPQGTKTYLSANQILRLMIRQVGTRVTSRLFLALTRKALKEAGVLRFQVDLLIRTLILIISRPPFFSLDWDWI